MAENDLEQAEVIKKWWKENGLAVVTGIALGLILLFGWRAWKSHEASQQEMASYLYSQVMTNFDQGNLNKARELASQLLSDYNSSAYAVEVTLRLARQAVEEGNYEAAHAHLDWVIKRNKTVEFTHIAQLRKARLLLAEQRADELKTLLDSISGSKGAFKIGFLEISGDLANLQGRIGDARSAYREALVISDGLEDGFSPEHKELVQMKLDSLGKIKSEQIVAAPPPAIMPETTDQIAELVETVETTEEIAEEQAVETVETTEEIAEEQAVETVEITEEIAEEQAVETVETSEESVIKPEITEPVAPIDPMDAKKQSLAPSIETLAEILQSSTDPETGAIPDEAIAETLDKLAPTLSEIATILDQSAVVETTEEQAVETVEPEITEPVAPIDPIDAKKQSLAPSIETLAEILQSSTDPETGAIPDEAIAETLDKLAPTLSEIATILDQSAVVETTEEQAVETIETTEEIAEVQAVETVEPEITEPVAPTDPIIDSIDAKKQSLAPSIETLAEILQNFADPETGGIPDDAIATTLDKLAPTLAEIATIIEQFAVQTITSSTVESPITKTLDNIKHSSAQITQTANQTASTIDERIVTKKQNLAIPMKDLVEVLEQSVDAESGQIPPHAIPDTLEQLAPALSEIAEILLQTPQLQPKSSDEQCEDDAKREDTN